MTPTRTNDEATSTLASRAIPSIRENKRRAAHRQIEKRRREKIQDQFSILQSLVPACSIEMEKRRKQLHHDLEIAKRASAGEAVEATTKEHKRRIRRIAKQRREHRQLDVGLERLDILSYAIEHIYDLHKQIDELRSCSQCHPTQHSRVDRNRAGSTDQTAREPVVTSSEAGQVASPLEGLFVDSLTSSGTSGSTRSSSVDTLAVMSLSAGSAILSS